MPSAPPRSADSPRQTVDVRTLTLAQLNKLAAQGSRRARAELEGRMRASASSAGNAPAPAPARTPAPTAPPPAAPPDWAAVRAAAAAAPATPASPPASAPHLQQAEQIALMARQDEQRARASGPPRLVGLVMIVWGALFLLGALVMLLSRASRLGGLYYLYCALGAAAVGWLLMRCSRWAMALHGALLLAALAWAFASAGGIGAALAQAIPLLIPVIWILVPQVREPLE